MAPVSAGSPYERALRDQAFLDRFAAAYRGVAEPIDALWWDEHPGEPAPGGAAAPKARLAELRRAVYTPGSTTADRERYERLRAEVDRDREAVREALAAVDAPAARVESAAPAATGPPAPVGTPGRRSARPALIAVLAASVAFVGGVLVAPALGGRAARQPGPAPTPEDTPPYISGGSGSGSALGIFGEPQRNVDRPAMAADARLLPSTFRRLQAVPMRGVDIYGAEDASGDVCLVAVAVSGRVSASCSPIPVWRRTPIRLTFRADAYTVDGRRITDQVELAAAWAFLGPFRLDERAP